DKILAAKATDTVRSRAMTGKPARQLRTPWTDAWDKPDPGALPMPLQFMLTAEATARIYRGSRAPGSRAKELLGTAIGQIVGRMNTVRTSRDVIYGLVEEFVEDRKSTRLNSSH